MITSGHYLFASFSEASRESPSNVFYRVDDDELATPLCQLCTKDFADENGHPAFHHKAVTLFSLEEQVLMEEALQWLAVYDEPDAGVYEVEPTPDILLRAEYAKRAQGWNELMRKQKGLRVTITEGSKLTSIKVFYSYSHADERQRKKLQDHLSPLKHESLISEWHDRKITGGSEWAGQIDEHLNSAHVILLLISDNFLASRYCHDVELKRAMDRHEAGEVRVIPIILKPCVWQTSPFGKLQVLPKDGKPISTWDPRDAAYADIVGRIREAILEMKASATDSPTTKTTHESLNAEVQAFTYDEIVNRPHDTVFFITAYPRRYVAKLALTNRLGQPLYLKSISAVVGAKTYGREYKAKPIRMEPHEYKEQDVCFLVEDEDAGTALKAGTFELVISPTVGEKLRIRGIFPLEEDEGGRGG